MKELDDCSMVGCCGNLKCVDTPIGIKQCQDLPTCWNKNGKDCSETPCCDGLTCIKKNERNVCATLPECVNMGRSCEWSPCCENEENPTQCVDVVDKKGRPGKQCRLVPGDVEVRVFNDVNANGIQEQNEPGIEGVKLCLVDVRDKTMLHNHHELATDSSGLVTFKEVPKGMPLRVKVTGSPNGAVRTLEKKGGDDRFDSDLRSDGMTRNFRVTGEKYTNTTIGYLLPLDAEVKVFNDLNGNGIQEEGELGIKGVKLSLVTRSKEGLVNLSNQGNGGTAHTELTTGESGIVSFTGCPQNKRLRVKVTEKPKGAIPTKANAGEDDAMDSDLRGDGMSHEFVINGGLGLLDIALGFRMPETVMVRVWDDANANGIQDKGEAGIKNVKLRLVNDDKSKTNYASQDNGDGNAHQVLTSDAEGLVTFTKVRQGNRLRVKVVEPPAGAVGTYQNKGNQIELDSDLGANGLSDSFTLSHSGAAFSEIDLGYRMPNSMIVRVWDDSNGNGIQDDSEAGIKDVKLCLVMDDKVTNLGDQNSGGNAHQELITNADGFVSFTKVPQNKRLRVKVTNAPKGATVTASNRGDDSEKDSDLEQGNVSDSFMMTQAGDLTEIDLGYRMPTEMVVRVWDDQNNNGIQDEGELGISNVKLRLIEDKGEANVDNQNNGGNADQELITNDDGLATFTGVPKIKLRVKVTNRPKGAALAQRNKGEDEEGDSDLRSDSTSDSFDLGTFTGSSFGSIDLGYLMPRDVEVRVWDDINGNGVQDIDEQGIENVNLRLIDAKKENFADQGNGGNSHQELTTDASGIVKFTQVPKGQNLMAKITNKPPGAIATGRNKGEDEGADSDLRSDLTSDAFNLNKFTDDGIFDSIDLGFRMPTDMNVRVWDDLNGNGVQDEGEPGIQGVKLRLVNADKDQTKLENCGGGSTAHADQATGEDGTVTFKMVPKGKKLLVKVLNAPKGSVGTQKNKGGNDETDSDLRADMTSDSFNLNSFTTAGAYGNMDLGFKMPKTMVVRAWNDANNNGKQDDGEEGIEGVQIRLVVDGAELGTFDDLPDQGNDGTAHAQLTTGADGRVTFEKVPQGIKMRVKVVQGPANASVAKKNKGNDQLDSDLNANGVTDKFQLPNDVSELYDMVDVGYVVA
jgi:hypothetical protein